MHALSALVASAAATLVVACDPPHAKTNDAPFAHSGDKTSANPNAGVNDANDASDANDANDANDKRFASALPRGPGCGRAALPGARTASIPSDAGARTYEVVVPDAYDAARAYPLVFVFHGDGGDGPSIRRRFGLEAHAKGGAIFVYPDAIVRRVWGDQIAKHWAVEDFPFIDATLAEVSRAVCIDSKRIFAVGFSGGGYFANELGCARGDVFRAISAVEGGGPFVEKCTGHPSALIFHDARDPVVPVAEGRRSLAEWTKRNACNDVPDARTPLGSDGCTTRDECADGAKIVYCERSDGVHTIPDGAAERTWAFFGASSAR